MSTELPALLSRLDADTRALIVTYGRLCAAEALSAQQAQIERLQADIKRLRIIAAYVPGRIYIEASERSRSRRLTMATDTLPADVARCPGYEADGEWRDDCEDCRRRTDRSSTPNPRQAWMSPPPIDPHNRAAVRPSG